MGARPKALAYINSLDKINDAQRTALVDKINQSHDLIEINHIVDDGTNLNDIMHELAQSIIDNMHQLRRASTILMQIHN